MEKPGSGALFAVVIAISAIGLLMIFKSSAPDPAAPQPATPPKPTAPNATPAVVAAPASGTSAPSATPPAAAPAGTAGAGAGGASIAATTPRTMSSPRPPAPDPDGPPPPAPPPPIPASREEARAVVSNVMFAVRDYRLRLGGNPVGNNEEITRSLLGDNVKQVKFPIPEGSVVNGSGELCDPWGTPYFFHAVSRDRMEIRSAGADRQMWTPDDVQE